MADLASVRSDLETALAALESAEEGLASAEEQVEAREARAIDMAEDARSHSAALVTAVAALHDEAHADGKVVFRVCYQQVCRRLQAILDT